MRFAAVLIVALVGLWILIGTPVPRQTLKPMQPNAEIPSFEDSMAEHSVVEEAVDMGRAKEDPERRALRQAFVEAYERLQLDPCDDALQQGFGKAALPFVEGSMGERQLPAETVTVNGRPMNASKVLEAEIFQNINTTLFMGGIEPENLPQSLVPVVQRMRALSGDWPGLATCGS